MASIPTSNDQAGLESAIGLSAGGTMRSFTGMPNYPSANNSPIDLGQFAAIAGGFSLIILVVMVWSMIWKGMALWYAARRGEKGWFVALLILNTVGILEIIYIFAVAKRSDIPVKKLEPTTPSTLPKI